MAGEEARRQLHKNVANNIEQVLEATTPKHQIYGHLLPIMKTTRTLLEMKGRAHKWCTPMNPHIWPGKSRTTSSTHTYSSSVRIRDVALKTCQRRWTIGRSGKRGQGYPCWRHDMMIMMMMMTAASQKLYETQYFCLTLNRISFFCFSIFFLLKPHPVPGFRFQSSVQQVQKFNWPKWCGSQFSRDSTLTFRARKIISKELVLDALKIIPPGYFLGNYTRLVRRKRCSI